MIKKKLIYLIIFFSNSFNISYGISNIELISLGSNYGNWTIPKKFLNETSICYCAGAGEDITFDIDLIKNFNCKVFTFDPTPRAIQHINTLRKNTAKGNPFFSIPNKIAYNANELILNNLFFYPFGLWNKDTIIKFYSPKNPAHVSHSITNLQKTDKYFQAQCYSLKTLMKNLNHTKINLLKLDIEGSEISVINYIINEKIDIDCICIEFDELVGVNLKNSQKNSQIKEKVDKTILALIKFGYTIIYRRNYDSVTFLKNELLKEIK